jgi:hypothetical protein
MMSRTAKKETVVFLCQKNRRQGRTAKVKPVAPRQVFLFAEAAGKAFGRDLFKLGR